MFYVDPNSPAGHSTRTAHSTPQKTVDPSQELIKISEAINSTTVVKLEKFAEQLDTAARRLTDQELNLGKSYTSGKKRKLSATDDPETKGAAKRVFSHPKFIAGQSTIRDPNSAKRHHSA